MQSDPTTDSATESRRIIFFPGCEPRQLTIRESQMARSWELYRSLRDAIKAPNLELAAQLSAALLRECPNYAEARLEEMEMYFVARGVGYDVLLPALGKQRIQTETKGKFLHFTKLRRA